MAIDVEIPTLVARFGALGDMVMLTPTLEVVSRDGRVPCEVLTSLGVAAELYRGLPSVGGVSLVRSKRTPYVLERSQRQFVRALRGKVKARRVGSALSFTVVPRVPWLLRRAGLPDVAAITHQGLPREELEHDVAYGERLTRELFRLADVGVDLPPVGTWPTPRLSVSDAERDDAREWLQSASWAGEPVVLIQSQSRKARRGRWPATRWTELMRHILGRMPEARVLLTGVPAEESALSELTHQVSDPRVTSVAAGMNLRRLCGLASMAHSMISLDTGPAHIAAAVGCPLVVLFGTEHPRRTRPTPRRKGWVVEVSALPPSQWAESRKEFALQHRMEAIPVDAVAEAWDTLSAAVGSER